MKIHLASTRKLPDGINLVFGMRCSRDPFKKGKVVEDEIFGSIDPDKRCIHCNRIYSGEAVLAVRQQVQLIESNVMKLRMTEAQYQQHKAAITQLQQDLRETAQEFRALIG